MGTVRKLPSGKYEGAVCCKGRRKSKTFTSKKDARRWCALAEDELERQGHVSQKTLLEAIEEYRTEVVSKQRGSANGNWGLTALEQYPIVRKRLCDLRREDAADFITQRSGKTHLGRPVKTSTVIREFARLRAVICWAWRSKGYLDNNPFAGVALPKPPEHRERTATEEELEVLCRTVGWDGKSMPDTVRQRIVAAFLLSCETGMRAGEIMAIEPSWLSESGMVVKLPATVTKTQSARQVPLSSRAREILSLVMQLGLQPTVFSLNYTTARVIWTRIRNAAGLGEVRDKEGNLIKESLHFHDGRATFATNVAKKIGPLDLARVTGHKDLKMLMRYYRPSAEEIAERLG